MSVTLLEVMAAAQARRAPLVAELAGYLVLGAADRSAGAPRQMSAADVLLSEDGSVRLVGAGTACAPDAAERSLRGLLRRLMGVASSARPALFRSTQRSPGAGVDALIHELETALIPVNRAAARRALSRLHRETARAIESGRVDVAAFEATEPRTDPQGEVDPRQSLPLEGVAAPEPPEAERSVPVAMLQASSGAASARLQPQLPPDETADRDEETGPEPAVARARASASNAVRLRRADPGVPLELSPPAMPVEAAPAPPAEAAAERESSSPRSAAAALPDTPTLGTLCDPDLTDRAPPVFDVLETPPPGQDVAPPDGAVASAAEVATAGFVEELDDEDIDWIEVDPSAEPLPCRAGEPFATAPSADPPGAAPRWRPSVVVLRGRPDAEPEPPPLEPTPPLRTPGVEPVRSAPPRFAPRQSDVSELLASFAVADARTETEIRGDLKRMAGLEPTPPPAEVRSADAADEGKAGPGEGTAYQAR